MLEQLTIRKLGLIDSAELRFSSGLIVISGETGAGKTLLLDGLVALTGFKPSSADMVADDTFVEGILDLSSHAAELLNLGVELDEGTLYIARQFPKDGKSKASLQAKSAPSSLLREIADVWVAIHGQHDTYRLLNSKTHLLILDEFGGEEITQARSAVSSAYQAYQAKQKQLKEFKVERDTAIKMAESLRTDVELCQSLAIQPEEDVLLAQSIELLTNAERVTEHLKIALDALGTSEISVTSGIETSTRALEKVSSSDNEVQQILELLRQAGESVQTAQLKLLALFEKVANPEANIDDLMQRQRQIKQLLQAHGPTVADLYEWQQAAERQLQLVDIGDEELQKLESVTTQNYEVLMSECQKLHDIRLQKAKDLESSVSKELSDLALGAARFEVEARSTDVSETGIDSVEFMFSANPGLKLSPLQDSASGGELSRLMLALEVSLLRDTQVPVMIFDEIDTGVAGATALAIAKKLVLVSARSQVLVVSHLPQIAAFADQHIVVQKSITDQVTKTDIRVLEESERVSELARMLAGLEGSQSAREHAEELLEKARAAKASLKK
ncbi:MAG: hypothetical protein RIS09_630 [Actinomycetota bacterium]|jgi:DNA repair protein RecN (Recombination protein N)